MKPSLYYAPLACSMVPLIALHEAGADFEVKTVNMAAGDHLKPEYLAINPKHKVPTLVIDGVVLTENVAILSWIARQYPAAQLLPTEPMDAVQALSLLAWFASGIHPTLTPQARPQVFCDTPDSAPSVTRLARERLAECLRVADDKLTGREWFFDRFTAVDAYFFWCMRRAGQLGTDTTAYPNAHAHFVRMQQRASVQKVLAYEAEVQAKQA